MKNSLRKLCVITLISTSLFACTTNKQNNLEITELDDGAVIAETFQEDPIQTPTADENTQVVTTVNSVEGSALDISSIFTDRDLEQTADLSLATTYTLKDGEDISIKEEGIYVLTGSAKDVTIFVDADAEDKIQIVLDDVSITNTDFPCIYVKNADKVFITTTDTENTLSVTGPFTTDGDTNTDGVIFSKDDIVLNGVGTLIINSTDNGVVSKDDLKVTGGTYNIIAGNKGFQANDSVSIADGTITIEANDDGIHVENDEDDTVGYFYLANGTLNINATDDAIHATTILQIDDGTLNLTGLECLEATYIQLNGGVYMINSTDDGINAAQKSSAYTPTVEINDGDITINMGQGDTDAIDSNGNLFINGGSINITAQSPFDYDGQGQLNGGTVIVNGQQITQLTNQMMGGGMMGDKPGGGMMPNGGEPPQGERPQGGPQGGFHH